MLFSEQQDPSFRQIQRNFDQNHSNLFDNIKRVYHPQHAAKEIAVIRSLSKKNLNISASQSQKKHQLQKSPSHNKSPLKPTDKISMALKEPSLLFTPSPSKIAYKAQFRQQLTTYHNNFVENLNNNLLVSNSYSKNFKEKGSTNLSYSNIAKTKSEVNLLNKSREILWDFAYNSNTNLNESEEHNHKRPNESQIGRVKYIEPLLEKTYVSPEERNKVNLLRSSPPPALDRRDEEMWTLRNELNESRTKITLLKEEINRLNLQNEDMQQKIVRIGSEQKEVINVIVNKHQNFIEKLIADKYQLSIKCEEYLLELKQQTKKQFSFQNEMDAIKKLSSNEETQNAYLKINKELFEIQSERGVLLDQSSNLNRLPSRTAEDDMRQSKKEDMKRSVNFNPVPAYFNDRKI